MTTKQLSSRVDALERSTGNRQDNNKLLPVLAKQTGGWEVVDHKRAQDFTDAELRDALQYRDEQQQADHLV